MKPVTLKALRASIQHWENNATPGKEETPYSSDCALCARFARIDKNGNVLCQITYRGKIERCPVFEKTGKPDCRGTPWFKAQYQYTKAQIEAFDLRQLPNYREFNKAAKLMLAFLKDLLPESASNETKT